MTSASGKATPAWIFMKLRKKETAERNGTSINASYMHDALLRYPDKEVFLTDKHTDRQAILQTAYN
jgi:hypothetical protein